MKQELIIQERLEAENSLCKRQNTNLKYELECLAASQTKLGLENKQLQAELEIVKRYLGSMGHNEHRQSAADKQLSQQLKEATSKLIEKEKELQLLKQKYEATAGDLRRAQLELRRNNIQLKELSEIREFLAGVVRVLNEKYTGYRTQALFKDLLHTLDSVDRRNETFEEILEQLAHHDVDQY